MSAQTDHLFVLMEWSILQDSPQVYRCLGILRDLNRIVEVTLAEMNGVQDVIAPGINLPESTLSRSDTSYKLQSVDSIRESLKESDSTVFGWSWSPSRWHHYVIYRSEFR